MSLLWFIIKIILLVCLSILLLGILVIGVILLTPFRYEGYFAKYEALTYDVKVRYLPGVKADFYLQNGVKKHCVRLFGKKLYEVSEKLTSDEAEVKKEQVVSVEKERSNVSVAKKAEAKAAKEVTDTESLPDTLMVSKERTVEEKVQKPFKTKQIEKNKEKQEPIATEKKKKDQQERDWKEIALNPLTYRAVKQILQGLGWLLKHVAPTEWDFEMVIGTGDPADTGELIAKLTMLYPLYYQHGIIRGAYEKECVMGGFLVKGRFQLISIVLLVVRLYFDKDVNAFIHLIKE